MQSKEQAHLTVVTICRESPYILNLMNAVNIAKENNLERDLIKELCIRVLSTGITQLKDGNEKWRPVVARIINEIEQSDYIEKQDIDEAEIRAIEDMIFSTFFVLSFLRRIKKREMEEVCALRGVDSKKRNQAIKRVYMSALRYGFVQIAEKIKMMYEILDEENECAILLEEEIMGLPDYSKAFHVHTLLQSTTP